MQFTAAGRYWRACAQSERLAKLCGVNTLTVLRWSCVGSAALASVSGWIIAVSYGGVTFSMGLMLGFKAMFASVIGGFGTVERSHRRRHIPGLHRNPVDRRVSLGLPRRGGVRFHHSDPHAKTGRSIQFHRQAGKRGLDEVCIYHVLLPRAFTDGVQGRGADAVPEDCRWQLHVQLPLLQIRPTDLWRASSNPCRTAAYWRRASSCPIPTANMSSQSRRKPGNCNTVLKPSRCVA